MAIFFTNPKLFWPLLFIIIASLLLIANFPEINTLHTESGDYAADSLLIQDAKSFKLLVGHYSFLGFNHPGPAILYVLAVGELLFFDWLHCVPSPFSGQLIAIALYNAFWIVLLANLLYKISCSARFSSLVLSLFLGIAVIIDYNFYSGAWPPYLFFFPFAVFLLSITIFQESRIDSLYSLALSMGFLVNGYASFIVLLGIMLCVGLIYNYWIYPGNIKILSKHYFIEYKRNLLIALGIFLLFLIPLFILTVIDFPGPLMDYVHYGRENKGHNLAEAVHFVASYWGGLLSLIFGMFICLFGVLFYKKYSAGEYFLANIPSLWITLISATLTLTYYAKCGVKFLFAVYVGFFYYTVPALFISTFIVIILLKSIYKKQIINLMVFLIVVVFIFLLCRHTERPLDEETNLISYRPELIQLYELLNQKKEDGRLALNFDYGHKGLELWSSVITVLNYAKRQHNDLFCINNDWNISFSKTAKCSKSESIYNKHFFIQHPDRPFDLKPFFRAKHIAVYPVERFNLTRTDYIRIPELLKSPSKKILEHGWSTLEFDYVWTEGKQSSLVFKLDKNFSGQIGLELVANLPQLDFIQEVAFYLNDQYIKKVFFSFADNRKLVLLPVNSSSDLTHLELRVKNPVSPASFGKSQDKRRLGVALFSVAIKPNKTSR